MIVFADVDPTTNPLNEFLKHYGIWIAVGIAALIFVTVLVFFFIALKKRKQNPIDDAKKENNIVSISSRAEKVLTALGGKENVIEHSCVGSRLSISLKDYSLLDEAALKKSGVTSLIKMEKKIILVIKDDCSLLYKELF